MSKYQIRFFFEWNPDYFWPDSDDEYTKARFDCYPINPRSLGLSEQLIDLLDKMSDEHLGALDWEYPPDPSPWSFEQFLDFEKRTNEAYKMIRDELINSCDVYNRNYSMETLANEIINAFSINFDSDEETLDKLLCKYGWDDVLRALQYILLQGADNPKLYYYVENMIWDGICDGRKLGVDENSVIALLYKRLGNVDSPYDDNTLWSIVSTIKGLDYANSKYNPLKDEKILAKLENLGL